MSLLLQRPQRNIPRARDLHFTVNASNTGECLDGPHQNAVPRDLDDPRQRTVNRYDLVLLQIRQGWRVYDRGVLVRYLKVFCFVNEGLWFHLASRIFSDLASMCSSMCRRSTAT